MRDQLGFNALHINVPNGTGGVDRTGANHAWIGSIPIK